MILRGIVLEYDNFLVTGISFVPGIRCPDFFQLRYIAQVSRKILRKFVLFTNKQIIRIIGIIEDWTTIKRRYISRLLCSIVPSTTPTTIDILLLSADLKHPYNLQLHVTVDISSYLSKFV